MSRADVIRAWTDPEYREGLSEAQRAKLPAHPAGWIELGDDELDAVAGGSCPVTRNPYTLRTEVWCCGPYPW
jgi:mersacidin/lichenicidin family type 2 lantibiotic